MRARRPHILGIDDGPVDKRSRAPVPVVGVMMEGADLVEAVAITHFPVDGAGATDFLARWVNGLRLRPALQAVVMGGITIAGLGILEVERFSRAAPPSGARRKSPCPRKRPPSARARAGRALGATVGGRRDTGGTRRGTAALCRRRGDGTGGGCIAGASGTPEVRASRGAPSRASRGTGRRDRRIAGPALRRASRRLSSGRVPSRRENPAYPHAARGGVKAR